MNKVILYGHLGKDAECRKLTESYVITFSLATSQTYTDNKGEKQTKTEWHNIAYFSKSEKIVEFLKKGTKLLVDGKITYRDYEKDGVKIYVTEILANSVDWGNKEKVSKKEDDLPF